MQTTAIHDHRGEPVPGEAWLRRFDDSDSDGYRCYPGVDRFIDAFGATQYRQALRQRAQLGALAGAPLALHVHIPHGAARRRPGERRVRLASDAHAPAAYVDALETEIALQAEGLGARRSVTRLHLGGDSSLFLDDDALERLLQSLHHHFAFAPESHCSAEVDPHRVTTQRLGHLAALGFRHLDFVSPDTDTALQPALHRAQPLGPIGQRMGAARALGFASIGIELIRGLPQETPAVLTASIERAVELAPDRIALRAWRHGALRQAAFATPPDATPRSRAHTRAFELLDGYRHLGLGCYALPGDALAVAKRQGRLQRNLLGYSAQPDSDLIGLGASAVGQVGAVYSQNTTAFDAYCDALRQGQLPVARGLTLGREDLLRRTVIWALLCLGRLDFKSFELAHLIDFRRHFAVELERLQRHADAGLVAFEAEGLEVTVHGCQAIGAIAGVFDAHRQAERERARCSGLL